MPRWAWVLLVVLALAATGAIILEGAVIFTMITRVHQTQMEVCRLYLVNHRSDPALVIPPSCLP